VHSTGTSALVGVVARTAKIAAQNARRERETASFFLALFMLFLRRSAASGKYFMQTPARPQNCGTKKVAVAMQLNDFHEGYNEIILKVKRGLRNFSGKEKQHIRRISNL
jgi:hypothetical protein